MSLGRTGPTPARQLFPFVIPSPVWYNKLSFLSGDLPALYGLRVKIRRMITQETIDEAVRCLVETAKPQKVILFGSYARGEAEEHSDLDFLVVERQVTDQRREMVRLHDSLRPLRIPVDIVVASEETFREWRDTPRTVYYDADRDGRVCYETSPDESS